MVFATQLYRKSFAPREPVDQFGLYAVATRHPAALWREVERQPVKTGVYSVRALRQPITVIVLKEIAPATRNALWALFSFEAKRVAQGAQDYVWRQPDHLPILQELYHCYQQVGVAMSYTFENFRQDLARELVLELPVEERLRGLTPEELMRGLTPEELMRGLTPEELLGGLSEAELESLRQLLFQGQPKP